MNVKHPDDMTPEGSDVEAFRWRVVRSLALIGFGVVVMVVLLILCLIELREISGAVT